VNGTVVKQVRTFGAVIFTFHAKLWPLRLVSSNALGRIGSVVQSNALESKKFRHTYIQTQDTQDSKKGLDFHPFEEYDRSSCSHKIVFGQLNSIE
jgi:hypothetical protein